MIIIISFWSNAVFIVLDILWFYISFEAVQQPMYYLITNYGSRSKTQGVHASYMFVIYTQFGSQFLFIGLLTQYIQSGSFNYEILCTLPIDSSYQYILWISFFICFAVKQPIIPFHIWLLTAHVEGSTAASVILAAILQKFGSYGQIRYNIALFPIATQLFQPFIWTQAILSILYSSIAALSQIDMKLIIAYSSIGHVGTTVQGLFSNDLYGIQAGILFMVSHGIISSAQFLQVGVLYDRYHTRTLLYYRGLSLTFPLFTTIFIFFSMANSGFPLTSGFIAEFLALSGIFNSNPLIALIASLSIVLVPAFMLNLLHRICYGRYTSYITIVTSDITIKEFHIFIPQIIFTIFLGISPQILFDSCFFNVSNLLFDMRI